MIIAAKGMAANLMGFKANHLATKREEKESGLLVSRLRVAMERGKITCILV